MAKPTDELSARERQILDSLYRRGEATVADIREDIPDPPTPSAMRTMLARLEAKGRVGHDGVGPRNVYRPTGSRTRARDAALDRVLRTFFEGSPVQAVAALLGRAPKLTKSERAELEQLIARAGDRRK